MPNRIRLTWNRNLDAETQYYRVFRDEQPDINHKTSLDRIVMKVEQPKGINPIKVTNEKLVRESERTYAIAHNNILLKHNEQNFPFKVMVDGEERTDFVLDTSEGKVIFDAPIPLNADVRVPEYHFDGIQVWDYEIEEPGKTYYGPEAKDTSPPAPPTNVTLEKDLERNRIILRWDAAVPGGKMYYYRIDAAIDEQRYSKLSELRNAFLREPLADRPYIIERSDDGKRWVQIARVKTNVFYEYMIDRHAPDAITGLTASVFLYRNRGDAQVTLKWDRVQDTTDSRTSMYRVRARNRVGMMSEPSAVVGPTSFKVDLSHILIRRKTYDGSLPSYDGNDAITVAKLTNLDQVQYIEDVPDNNYYVYGLWVVDKGGNYSTIASVSVVIGDATAPGSPVNLSAREFHMTVG